MSREKDRILAKDFYEVERSARIVGRKPSAKEKRIKMKKPKHNAFTSTRIQRAYCFLKQVVCRVLHIQPNSEATDENVKFKEHSRKNVIVEETKEQLF